MPLTDNGFDRQTFDEILADQIENAADLFGDNIDTSDQSVFGKILRLWCSDAATNQELAEQVYLSAFPGSATGVSLDRLCVIAGITRNPATYAQHTVTITGTAGATVEMGFLVASGGVEFHTVDDYTIGDNGTVTAIVECNEAGTVGNVAAGSINVIVNPASDVTSVSGSTITTVAVDEETDYALRNRFQTALSGAGTNSYDAISGAIMRVSGVEGVLIQENETDATVGDLPPHSFRCYVLAPTSAQQEIAEAIFSKKPIGVPTYGDVSSTVTDASGNPHTILFSWTQQVPIYVKATISTNSAYSAESLAEIQQNIVNKLSAYTNGQSVTATSLYGAIYVDGVTDVTSLTISSDGATYSTDTIAIAASQVARSTAANIEVTVSD